MTKTRKRYPLRILGKYHARNYMICKLHLIDGWSFNQLAKKYNLTPQRMHGIVRRYKNKFRRLEKEEKSKES